MHPAPIANIATSVNPGVSIQNLFVPTVAGCSYSVGVSGNRGGIDREEQSGTGPPLAYEREDTVIGVV